MIDELPVKAAITKALHGSLGVTAFDVHKGQTLFSIKEVEYVLEKMVKNKEISVNRLQDPNLYYLRG